MTMATIHLDLIYRDSHAYQQGRNDALNGRTCRTDGEVFGGYYISYVAGYEEAEPQTRQNPTTDNEGS
jgi:hypothetical protein